MAFLNVLVDYRLSTLLTPVVIKETSTINISAKETFTQFSIRHEFLAKVPRIIHVCGVLFRVLLVSRQVFEEEFVNSLPRAKYAGPNGTNRYVGDFGNLLVT